MAEAASEGTDVMGAVYGDAAMLDDLTNMSAPQPRYAEMVKQGVIMPMPGMAMPASRDAVETVLRHHEVFTSDFGFDLGNIRPLIPLSVDPPRHSKFRKILD